MPTYYYQFVPIRTCRRNIIMLIANSSTGSEDFTSALIEELGNVGGKTVAMPIGGDAGVITSLVRADRILRTPQDVSGLFDMIYGRRKNSCVILVKRFIDIPPYLKWDRGAAFHKCKDTIARLLSES